MQPPYNNISPEKLGCNNDILQKSEQILMLYHLITRNCVSILSTYRLYVGITINTLTSLIEFVESHVRRDSSLRNTW